MKGKVIQIVLLCFIVFMMGGILSSVKDNNDNDISNVISDFENNSEFDTSGYISNDPFDEDNVNAFGRLNGTVGKMVSEGVDKGIDLIFDIVKKIVS